jgi:Na+/H+ antiporter NhaD/arsenite permease-like protein
MCEEYLKKINSGHCLLLLLAVLVSAPVLAAGGNIQGAAPVLTEHWAGYAVLVIFILAYLIVILEEYIEMRKSKPVIVAAGIIWMVIAFAWRNDAPAYVEEQIKQNLLEFGELFLFLLSAMTYINTMQERGVFECIRGWLVTRRFSMRAVFWLTGLLAFFLSPVADNLTTALVMSTVVMSVGGNNRPFIIVACINVVVAANAGGAFSPFGDITTLMVWQKNILEFDEFLPLFVPSLVNWLVPAFIMSFSIKDIVHEHRQDTTALRHGALVIVALFVLTITMAVCGHNYLNLPPVMGMMTGLGLLKIFGFYLTNRDKRLLRQTGNNHAHNGLGENNLELSSLNGEVFNIYDSMKKVEWDTLMFFYGVILCVGGLGTVGYLTLVSGALYGGIGATASNILIGSLSAIVDNIPLMFAVLSMHPDMSMGQWQLVTLTVGVGGSMLSIGSAAGVAVMGQAQGVYTFFTHLKWIWAIALGYAASIAVHFLINASEFTRLVGTG